MSGLSSYLFQEEPGITLYCGDALTVLQGSAERQRQEVLPL